MRNLIWYIESVYGLLFGWPVLATFHHACLNLALYGLGYGNVHHSGEARCIKRVISRSNPKIIFDVGANIGNYTALLLEHTNAVVYACEPNPDCVEKLHVRFADEPRVHIFAGAMGNEVGQASLYASAPYDEKATLVQRRASGIPAHTVPLETIANYAALHELHEIDFLKIDTEGFELEVLEGLGNIRPKIVQFEFNIDHLHRDHTVRLLATKLPGYRMYRILPHGTAAVDPLKHYNNVFMFSNYLAVREDVVV